MTPLPGTTVRWRHILPIHRALVADKRISWRTAVLVSVDADEVVLQNPPFAVPVEGLQLDIAEEQP